MHNVTHSSEIVGCMNYVQAIEHYIWSYKFKDKMDLTIRMRAFNNAKHREAVCLKFGKTFFTSLINLVPEAKASICSLSVHICLYLFVLS